MLFYKNMLKKHRNTCRQICNRLQSVYQVNQILSKKKRRFKWVNLNKKQKICLLQSVVKKMWLLLLTVRRACVSFLVMTRRQMWKQSKPFLLLRGLSPMQVNFKLSLVMMYQSFITISLLYQGLKVFLKKLLNQLPRATKTQFSVLWQPWRRSLRLWFQLWLLGGFFLVCKMSWVVSNSVI